MDMQNAKHKQNRPVRSLTRAALMIALLAVLSQVTVLLPISPVPITLQTLGVMLCALVLPPRDALFALGGYTLLGTVGLPVFSPGGTAGLARLAGPTGGFIIGFLPLVYLLSLALRCVPAWGKGVLGWYTLCAAVFSLLVYVFGCAWFMLVMRVGAAEAIAACALPFLPGDACKCVVFGVVAWVLQRRMSMLWA